jgi:chaperone modulatory protein CbpM
MENELLRVEEFCTYYNVEYNFLELLHEHDLIEIININQQYYLHTDALSNLETLLRMHYDLSINLEGIEVINNLLLRVNNLHQQIMHLKNKLKVYEDEGTLNAYLVT